MITTTQKEFPPRRFKTGANKKWYNFDSETSTYTSISSLKCTDCWYFPLLSIWLGFKTLSSGQDHYGQWITVSYNQLYFYFTTAKQLDSSVTPDIGKGDWWFKSLSGCSCPVRTFRQRLSCPPTYFHLYLLSDVRQMWIKMSAKWNCTKSCSILCVVNECLLLNSNIPS